MPHIVGPRTQVPSVTVGGGSDWYSDTAFGDCGSATISGRPTGTPGGWEAFLSLDSTADPVQFGSVTMTWGGQGGSDTYTYSESGEYRTGAKVLGRVAPGALVGIITSGSVELANGVECFVEEPGITFATAS